MKRLTLIAASLLIGFAPALACAETMPMPHMQHTAQIADPFAPAMQAMHQNMPMATGDIDHDFLAQMIPHHQAAVDMAKIELAQGHDPKVKAFAQQILDAQQAEITQMQGWLAAPPQPRH